MPNPTHEGLRFIPSQVLAEACSKTCPFVVNGCLNVTIGKDREPCSPEGKEACLKDYEQNCADDPSFPYSTVK